MKSISILKLIFFSFFVIFIFVSQLHSHSNYPYNEQVPLEIWNVLEPYFLPINHPIKPRLDYIFKKRVTASKQTFEKAGFKPIYERKPTNIIIGKHALLKGYILKLFLDTQPKWAEWKNWIDRIEGSRVIKEAIKVNKLKYFDVPKKWIYPLPKNSDLDYPNAKHFILVVEDMGLLSGAENKKAFKEKMTTKMLNELFLLLSTCGLLDSVYIDNIPFNKSGKICFIDTEHYQKWPVPYEKLSGAFSSKMQEQWKKLIVAYDRGK